MIQKIFINPSLLNIFFSSLLYSSTEFFFTQPHFLNQIRGLIPDSVKAIILWLTLICQIVSILMAIKYKKFLVCIEFTKCISLPWAIHEFFTYIRVVEEAKKGELGVITVLIFTTSFCLLQGHWFPIIYDSIEANSLLRVQNMTIFLQITRLWAVNIFSLFFQGNELILVLILMNLIVTTHKILNITYFNLTIEYAYILMELWTWVSLLITFLHINQSQPQFEPYYFAMPLLFYLMVKPPSNIISLFQQKLKFNLKRYQSNRKACLSILKIYYFSRTMKKQVFSLNDELLSLISPQFQVELISLISNKLTPGLINQLSLTSQTSFLYPATKFQDEDYLEQNSSRRRQLLKINALIKNKSVFKELLHDKQYANAAVLFSLLVDFKLLDYSQIYEIYYQKDKEGEQNLLRRLSFEIYVKILKRGIVSMNEISKFPVDQLVGIEQIENKIWKYIDHESAYLMHSKALSDHTQTKQYFSQKTGIKYQIRKSLDKNKIKGMQCQSIVYFQYIFTKYIECNPFSANCYLKKKIEDSKENCMSSTFYSLAKHHRVVFVTNLPKEAHSILHVNKSFRELMGNPKTQQINLRDILPEFMRDLHDKQMVNGSNELYKHQNQPYYIWSPKQTKYFEVRLQIKPYINLNQSLLILSECEVDLQNSVQIRKQKCPSIKNDKFRKRVIMGRQVWIEKQACGEMSDKQGIESYGAVDRSVKLGMSIEFKKEESGRVESERRKDQLNVLKYSFFRHILTILILFILLLLLSVPISFQINSLTALNTHLNSIQNQFYRYVISVQFYLPTLLIKAQSAAIHNFTVVQNQQFLLEECEMLLGEFQDYIQELDNSLRSPQLQSDIFQPITKSSVALFNLNSTYFFDIIQNTFLDFIAVASSVANDNKNQILATNFLLHSLQLINFIKTSDLFEIMSNQCKQKLWELEFIRTFFYYLILVSFPLFIISYLSSYLKIHSELQAFFKKTHFSSDLLNKLRRNLKNLRTYMLNSSQILSQGTKKIREREISLKQDHENLFVQSGSFYPYKWALLLTSLTLASVIVTFYLSLNFNSYPPIITQSSNKFHSKLILTRFVLETTQQIQSTLIRSLNEENELYQFLEKHQFESLLKNNQDDDVLQLLRNFTIGHTQIQERVHENQCDFWINCDQLIEEHGEKPKTLIGIKNNLKILLRNIRFERESNETLFYEKASGMQSIQKGIVEMDMLSQMIDEIFETDSELTNEEMEGMIGKSFLVIQIIIGGFLIIFAELVRMWTTYHKVRKQLYSILPLHILREHPSFSPEINLLAQKTQP